MKLTSYIIFDEDGGENWYWYRGKFHNVHGWSWQLVIPISSTWTVKQEFYHLNGKILSHEEWVKKRNNYL